MQNLFESIVSTVVGSMFFIVPIVILFIIFSKVFNLLQKVFYAMHLYSDLSTFAGVILYNLILVLLIVNKLGIIVINHTNVLRMQLMRSMRSSARADLANILMKQIQTKAKK
jgi:uncharacterized membrane protein